ncbi:hypothetical protein CANCADRAFT_2248 [Tortispora caseinolytica NRRL Y-17796]|uniref:U3 small nucleolar RNA-associated protein 13 C-terminal domain-containing protein n=1 Tax=Tortispora caseinolytica NRRL Y-17796 TaxID=767744 RepID=A0A1E4TFG9_9ASCO|nr:hypothetical protein CANCADRAFT_2248 [Tortispora caseinolytica NRRL Y-17796]
MATVLRSDYKPHSFNPIYSGGTLAVSFDKDLLVTPIGEDVVIVKLSTGEEIARIEGDGELVTSLSLTHSAQYLVVFSRSFQMSTYTLPSCTLVRKVKAHTAPVIVSATDDTSTLLASGASDGSIKVWDIEGGFTTHNLKGHRGVISALKIWGESGGSKWWLASGADDCTVRIWDLVSRKCIAVLDGHTSVIRGLDFNADASVLVSGGRDRVICVWDTKSHKLQRTIPALSSLETVGFLSPEISKKSSGLIVYSGGMDGSVRTWNIATSEEILCTIPEAENSEEEIGVSQIVYDGHNRMIVVLSDQTIVDMDLDQQQITENRRMAGHHAEIIDCTFVGEKDQRLAIAANSAVIRLLSSNGFEHNALRGHKDVVISLDRSVDGKWLASSSKDNTAIVWRMDLENNRYTISANLIGHAGSVGAVCFAKLQGRRPTDPPPFIVTGSQDLTVKVWQLDLDQGSTCKALYTRKAHDKDINAIDVAPNDKTFATASQDRSVKIWDTDSGEIIGILKGHKRGVWSVKYSKYDKVIATCSGDMTAKLWNLNDYTCLKTFEGHSNSVLRVLFITEGHQLATSGGEGLVKVWNVKSGECDVTLDAHEDKVWSLAAKEDGRVLVSGSGDSVLTIWTDVTEEKIAEDEQKRTKQVEQEQELNNYLFKKDWKNAILMAMSMDYPMKLLNLFRNVIANGQDEDSVLGLRAVDDIVSHLSSEQLASLLGYIRDWNTNARTSIVAQRLLHVILRSYKMTELAKLKGFKQLADALVPYTEKHVDRITRLQEEGSIIEYTLERMMI